VNPEILKLPVQIQIALASGYAAYMVSTYGARGHHSATDTAFRTLAYGLVASGLMALLPPGENLVIGGGTAFVVTVLVGLLWRARLCKLWDAFMRRTEVTFSDDSPSAWASLSGSTDHYVSQVSVTVDDHTTLICEDISRFANAPFGPCVLGANGDVALYVTAVKRNGSSKTQGSVRDPHYGDRITWIPATEVRRLTLRHLPK
jgi:hypothetical protein